MFDFHLFCNDLKCRHESLNGIVNEDIVRAQLLYELQGNIYLNNDVKADIGAVSVKEIGTNR